MSICRALSFSAGLSLVVLVGACSSDSGEDGRDDTFMGGGKADVQGVAEGSPEALGVLRVANEFSKEEFEARVGLVPRTAGTIASYRAGADQQLGTMDDERIDDLAELDSIPWVGEIAFAKLLAFARSNGWVLESGLLVINEVLADPPVDYDANGDGAYSWSADEFIELVNVGEGIMDLSGATVSDRVGTRVVMPAGTMVGPGCALVIAGGGAPSLPVPSLTGRLVLNNDGDLITVAGADGATLASFEYGLEGGNDTSMVRAVDGDTSAGFVLHNGIATAVSSAGTRSDGSTFACQLSGESCDNPVPLAIGSGTITGSTETAADDTIGSCGGKGNDLVYRFELPIAAKVRFATTGYDTVIHLRSICGRADRELACNDDASGGSLIETELGAGVYFLWVDSFGEDKGGMFKLEYRITPDPCFDDEARCPGTPMCQAMADWSGHECVCPAGTVGFEGDCVDDPCDPNQCTEEHKTACVAELPGGFHCECAGGFIADPAGTGACVPDPNANAWTVAVFMNADNNLESFGYDDLDEMMAVGSTPYVNIVVLMDSASEDGGKARHLYVKKGELQTLDDLGEIDMGQWQALADFGGWVAANYPARHYAFVMWDHGSGWDSPPNPLKGFSNDEHGTYAGISVAGGDYAKALEAITAAVGGKVDLFGFDACLMGMWEIANATAPYANYLVASSETEPGEGWPYTAALGPLVANHSMSAADLGKGIVEAYYAAGPKDATLAVTDLGTIAELNFAVSGFADALRASSAQYAEIDSLRLRSQSFSMSGSYDLKDFAARVAAATSLPASLREAATALMSQLERSVLLSRAQSDYSGSNGLAIYLTGHESPEETAYLSGAGAVWSTASTWDEFLCSY